MKGAYLHIVNSTYIHCKSVRIPPASRIFCLMVLMVGCELGSGGILLLGIWDNFCCDNGWTCGDKLLGDTEWVIFMSEPYLYSYFVRVRGNSSTDPPRNFNYQSDLFCKLILGLKRYPRRQKSNSRLRRRGRPPPQTYTNPWVNLNQTTEKTRLLLDSYILTPPQTLQIPLSIRTLSQQFVTSFKSRSNKSFAPLLPLPQFPSAISVALLTALQGC